jgi:hypothetical protein
MSSHTVTMRLPERIYVRLQQTAQATKQSFGEILQCKQYWSSHHILAD